MNRQGAASARDFEGERLPESAMTAKRRRTCGRGKAAVSIAGMVSEEQMHANYTFALRRVGTMAEGAAAAEVGPWSLMYSGLPEGRSNIGVLTREPGDVVEAMVGAEGWFEQYGVLVIRFTLRI